MGLEAFFSSHLTVGTSVGFGGITTGTGGVNGATGLSGTVHFALIVGAVDGLVSGISS